MVAAYPLIRHLRDGLEIRNFQFVSKRAESRMRHEVKPTERGSHLKVSCLEISPITCEYLSISN